MRKNILSFLLVIISTVVLFSNINGISVYILDESKNATCAREMLDRNDFVVPSFNNELRTDKPPLHYYFMMFSYTVFGVNEFAARFFSVVSGIGTLLLIFFFARRHFSYKTAFYTVLILISSLHFTLEFHLAVPDPYLIFFMTLIFISFYNFYTSKKRINIILFYIALGLACLTKGPIALALPGLTILLFLIFHQNFTFKTIKSFKILLGTLIFSVIALPWYILVGIKTNGDWLNGFFFKHNIERFTSSMEGHGGLFFLPIAFLIIGLLPFSIFIFRAFQTSWKARKLNSLHLYLILISTIIIVFFSISNTKLPNYIMPAYPFVAIILANHISNLRKKSINDYIIVSFLIGLLIPLAAYFGLALEATLTHLKIYSLLFLIIPISASLALIYSRSEHYSKSLTTLALGWVLTSLLFYYVIFPKVDTTNPVSETRRKIGNNFENVKYHGRYNPSFSFYAKKIIPRLNTPEEVQEYFETVEDPILISTKKHEKDLIKIDQLNKIVETKNLFELPTTVVYVKD